jgi:hypothetical protein
MSFTSIELPSLSPSLSSTTDDLHNGGGTNTEDSQPLVPLVIPAIGQFPPPLVKEESKHGIYPWIVKQGRQIVRFDIAALLNFRAIIMVNKTFLLER